MNSSSPSPLPTDQCREALHWTVASNCSKMRRDSSCRGRGEATWRDVAHSCLHAVGDPCGCSPDLARPASAGPPPFWACDLGNTAATVRPPPCSQRGPSAARAQAQCHGGPASEQVGGAKRVDHATDGGPRPRSAHLFRNSGISRTSLA